MVVFIPWFLFRRHFVRNRIDRERGGNCFFDLQNIPSFVTVPFVSRKFFDFWSLQLRIFFAFSPLSRKKCQRLDFSSISRDFAFHCSDLFYNSRRLSLFWRKIDSELSFFVRYFSRRFVILYFYGKNLNHICFSQNFLYSGIWMTFSVPISKWRLFSVFTKFSLL